MEQRQVAALAGRDVTARRGLARTASGQPSPLDELTDTVAPVGHALDGLGRRQDRHEPAHSGGPGRGIHHDVRGPRCICTDFSSVKASMLNRPNSRPMPLSL